jgi:flagellar biosynthesis/type III secretory pathway M-ring protein FliF/YscJ
MSLWAIGMVVAVIALLVPIVVFALDSPMFKRFSAPNAEADGPAQPAEEEDLATRVRALEDDVDELSRAVSELRDDAQYLQSLLDQASRREPTNRSAPPDS